MKAPVIRIACALILGATVTAAASAGEAPAPGDVPPGGAVRPPSAGRRVRSVFEYIETLTISGAEGKLTARSNVVVAVTPAADGLKVELRPSPGRTRTKPDDPAPGKVTLTVGDGAPTEVDLEALAITLRFDPASPGNIAVEGLSRSTVMEAVVVLSQGPSANVLKSDAVAAYEIELQSAGAPRVIRAEQRNGKLWVDWTLTGAGTFDVGGKGWELPMKFVLPKQEILPDGMTLAAEAEIRYSSVRPGPENETRLVTTIAAAGEAGEPGCVRTSELRPLALNVGEEAALPAEGAPKKLWRKTSSWARTATLVTLGVQRLAGVKETGIAMWLCQVSIDRAAAGGSSPFAEPEARRVLARLEDLSPELSPPPGFEEARARRRMLPKVEVSQNYLDLTCWADGRNETGSSDFADIAASVRWRKGRRWKFGAELKGLRASVGTAGPSGTCQYYGIMGRTEFHSSKWNASVSLGAVLVEYEVDSYLRRCTGEVTAFGVGVEGEWMVKKALGLGVGLDWASKGGLDISRVKPCLRWYLDPNVAIQAHAVWLSFIDRDVAGGEVLVGDVAISGNGFGMGILVRW